MISKDEKMPECRFPLLCPVCSGILGKQDGCYCCSLGHSFDISRKGYVNLLLNSSKGRHGDDRMMVNARTAFLERGYYDRFSEAVCNAVIRCTVKPENDKKFNSEFAVIDAGCGEGKYTADLIRRLHECSVSPSVLAADISKDAMNACASRVRRIPFSADLLPIVASTAKLPVPDSCADVLINIFAPFFGDEFRRVLKSGGKIIRAVPLENHLLELKQLVYDKVYLNDVPDYEEEGFNAARKEDVSYSVSLQSTEDISNLFLMTPYYYKTGSADQNKLTKISQLEVTLAFRIITYEIS